jgi:RimJ/RimL family protein N-acetyltransferase
VRTPQSRKEATTRCADRSNDPSCPISPISFSFARAYQGQGFATEAVGCLLAYLFGDLGLHRVVAITDAKNLAVARLLERLGLRREGTFVENIWFKGAWGSEFSYALLHREWARKDCA